MTLITSWIGVDQKKDGKRIASLYIATDSRFSWNNSTNFDHGVKIFGCINSPEIFGFYGDVTFSTNIINQLINQIDIGVFFKVGDTHQNKFDKVFDFIATSVSNYPKTILNQSFTILYGTRINKDFYLFKYFYNIKKNMIESEAIELPNISTKVFSGGSGAREFDEKWIQYQNGNHNESGTSRGVYQCLIKTIYDINDPFTGGVPQIIGLYRIKNSIIFGSVIKEKLYLYGKEYKENMNSGNIEWRNENFERVNPETRKILDGAQRQPSKEATP